MTQHNTKSTPVLLLTGYLGSGKTTLVNHILSNKKGIQFAVIVNDIGEVNIDASLIQQGGIVNQKDESLIALQNGCICCTLQMDLVDQLNQIMERDCFDYIVIEASGICEPQPIADTICNIPALGEEYTQWGIPELDCIVTVVDAIRMKTEFSNGNNLLGSKIGEEDIENLIIQQIEFCNIILLNKVAEVEPQDIEFLRQIIAQLNPGAHVIETNYAQIELEQILNTHYFDFDETESSANWIRQMERLTTPEENEEALNHHLHHHDEEDEEHEHHHHHHDEEEEEHEHHHHHHDEEEEEQEHHHHDDEEEEHEHHHHDDDDDDEHEEGHHHHHHHHHHHGEGEAEEYGIGTFVYYRRQPFDIEKFDRFVNVNWPKSVIRAKGLCYFTDHEDMAYLFEQAGVQVGISPSGKWCATMPDDELQFRLEHDVALANEWDDFYGDRMQKIVFIGQKMDKEAITKALDECLVL